MLSTGVSLWLRAVHLAFFDDLLAARQALLDLAAQHVVTVIPIYTHGVQAQPTSLAQCLLGFLAGLQRTSCRAIEAFARCNRSPLGAGAGTTSSFLISGLAEVLGFDAPVDNAFDANLVARWIRRWACPGFRDARHSGRPAHLGPSRAVLSGRLVVCAGHTIVADRY
jgi:argininosuccinate lyase